MIGLRKYIRNILLTEGLAGHGNKLLLLKIVDEIEAGNYEFLGETPNPMSWKDSFSFRLTRSGLSNVWNNATPELLDFLEKKFTTHDFFIRNLTRIKWLVVSAYKEARTLGQASNSSGQEQGWRNKKTGEEVWPSDDKWDNEGNQKFKEIQFMGTPKRKAAGWIKVYRSVIDTLDTDSRMRLTRGYISIKEENGAAFNTLKANVAQPQALADWFRSKLQSDSNVTWEHEFQHWIQFLSYFTSRDDRTTVTTHPRSGNNPHPGTRGPVSNLVLRLFNANFQVQVKVDEAVIENGKKIVPLVPGTLVHSEVASGGLKYKRGTVTNYMINVMMKVMNSPTPDQETIDMIWRVVQERVPSNTLDEFLSDARYLREIRDLDYANGRQNWYAFEFEFYDEKGKVIKSDRKLVEKATSVGFWRVTSSGRQRTARMTRSQYTSRFNNRSGHNIAWEDSIMEWDAELAAEGARLVREVTDPRKSVIQARELVVKLFISDTEAAKVRVRNMLTLYMARFNNRTKIMKDQQDSFNNTVDKITDYLQECVDRVDSESYITPTEWRSVRDHPFSQYELLKDKGWIIALRNEINQTNYP